MCNSYSSSSCRCYCPRVGDIVLVSVSCCYGDATCRRPVALSCSHVSCCQALLNPAAAPASKVRPRNVTRQTRSLLCGGFVEVRALYFRTAQFRPMSKPDTKYCSPSSPILSIVAHCDTKLRPRGFFVTDRGTELFVEQEKYTLHFYFLEEVVPPFIRHRLLVPLLTLLGFHPGQWRLHKLNFWRYRAGMRLR